MCYSMIFLWVGKGVLQSFLVIITMFYGQGKGMVASSDLWLTA